MTVTAHRVTPQTYDMASTETLPLAFDLSPVLALGETVSSPSCVLTDLTTGRPHAAGLSGSPSLATSTVTQTVTALQPGHRYRLTLSFTVAAGKVRTVELIIECPF